MNIFGLTLLSKDSMTSLYKRIEALEKEKLLSVSGVARNDVQLLLGASYDIIEIKEEAEIWGLIDISSLLKGDVITVDLKSKRIDGDYKLVDSQEYTINKSPLVVFKSIRLPSIQISIRQDKGISRKIGYQFKWNYI